MQLIHVIQHFSCESFLVPVCIDPLLWSRFVGMLTGNIGIELFLRGLGYRWGETFVESTIVDVIFVLYGEPGILLNAFVVLFRFEIYDIKLRTLLILDATLIDIQQSLAVVRQARTINTRWIILGGVLFDIISTIVGLIALVIV